MPHRRRDALLHASRATTATGRCARRRARSCARSAAPAARQRAVRPRRGPGPGAEPDARRRQVERRVRLIRPMERATIAARRDFAQIALAARPTATNSPRPGRPNAPSVPEFAESSVHIVTGLLLPIWDRLPRRHARLPLQTDDGERVIGRLIAPGLGRAISRSAPRRLRSPPAEAWTRRARRPAPCSISPDGLQLRRARSWVHTASSSPASPTACVDRLKAHRPHLARSSPGSCGCSCPTAPTRPGDPRRAARAPSARRASPTAPRRDGGAPCPSHAADLARRLARDAEAVCRHYLSNGRRAGPLLARRRCRQHAGPQPLCPPAGTGQRQGRRRQMDRRRHRRAWRSARPDRAQPAASTDFRDVLDEARRFLACRDREPPRRSARPPAGAARIA